MGVILQVMEPAAMSPRGVHVPQGCGGAPGSACPPGVCMSPRGVYVPQGSACPPRGVHVPLECGCAPGVCISPWSVVVPQYLEVWHVLHSLSNLCHHKYHGVLHLLQRWLKHQASFAQAELHLEEGERGGPPFGDLAHKHINGAGEKTTEQVA